MARYCYLTNDEEGQLICTVNHRDNKKCDLYKEEEEVMSDSKSTELYEKIVEQVALAHEKNSNLDRYQRMAGATSQVIKSSNSIMKILRESIEEVIGDPDVWAQENPHHYEVEMDIRYDIHEEQYQRLVSLMGESTNE